LPGWAIGCSVKMVLRRLVCDTTDCSPHVTDCCYVRREVSARLSGVNKFARRFPRYDHLGALAGTGPSHSTVAASQLRQFWSSGLVDTIVSEELAASIFRDTALLPRRPTSTFAQLVIYPMQKGET
jgi:hypothetical protein